MEGYTKARHQAAGHDGAMVDESGMVFIKPTTQQETDFYTAMQSLPWGESKQCDLSMFIPAFMGTLELGISQQIEKTQQVTDELRELEKNHTVKDDRPYAVMENLLHGYTYPSIMDVKLGSVLYDENTSDEKRERLQKVSDTTTSGSLNYRVCGMKIYASTVPDLSKFNDTDGHVTPDEDGYISFDKWYGRALRVDNVVDHFRLFFTHNFLSREQRTVVIENMLTRLELLCDCLEQTEVRIRSGSILITYENNPDRWNAANNEDPLFADQLDYDEDEDEDEDVAETPTALSQLNVIDFAHATITLGQGPDHDIIKGIKNLIRVFKQLL